MSTSLLPPADNSFSSEGYPLRGSPPPAVSGDFRKENVYRPSNDRHWRGPAINAHFVILKDEAPAAPPDHLDDGQSKLHSFNIRQRSIRAQGGKRISLHELGAFCLRESGVIDNKNVLAELIKNMKPFEIDKHRNEAYGSDLQLTIVSSCQGGSLKGKVWLVNLSKYNRSEVPAEGMAKGHAVCNMCDYLVVCDPAYFGEWAFLKKIVPPHDPDPLLLAIINHPTKALPRQPQQDGFRRPDPPHPEPGIFILSEWR